MLFVGGNTEDKKYTKWYERKNLRGKKYRFGQSPGDWDDLQKYYCKFQSINSKGAAVQSTKLPSA